MQGDGYPLFSSKATACDQTFVQYVVPVLIKQTWARTDVPDMSKLIVYSEISSISGVRVLRIPVKQGSGTEQS